MTLSEQLKNEILDGKYSDCCKLALLSGIVRGVGTLDFGIGGFGLTLTTKNVKLFQKTADWIDSLVKVGLEASEKNTDLAKAVYILKLMPKEAEQLLEMLEVTKNKYEIPDFPTNIVNKECCFKSFLKGLIVANGSLVLPYVNRIEDDEDSIKRVKCYNLEIIFNNNTLAQYVREKLNENFRIEIKSREKKKNTVLYLKDKETISDLFAYLGLSKTVIALQNFIILQFTKNTANRIKNFDVANLNKSVDASVKQIQAIEDLMKKGKFEMLNEELKRTAMLRRDNPNSTLDELRELFPKEITKSCLNHRLRKLITLSEENK